MIERGFQTRSWDELKTETLVRAERGAYPVFAITPSDARDALAMIGDLDPDAWGGAWMAIGDRYLERAQKMQAGDTAKAAQDYLAAWRLYTLGRWPVMAAPKKRQSYDKAQQAFAAYGRAVPGNSLRQAFVRGALRPKPWRKTTEAGQPRGRLGVQHC